MKNKMVIFLREPLNQSELVPNDPALILGSFFGSVWPFNQYHEGNDGK